MSIDIVFQLQLQAQQAELVTFYSIFYLLTELVSSVCVAEKSALRIFKSMQ